MTRTHTIEQLHRLVKAWVDGRMGHLFITGMPGSGKSHAVKQTEAHTIGSSSPFELYKQLVYAASAGHKLIVIDDFNTDTFRRGRGADLIKQVLNPEPGRLVSWHSNRTGRGKVPAEFNLTARVCIITNHVGESNEHVRAIMERCFTIEHLPSGEKTLEFAQEARIVPASFITKLREIAPSPLYLSLRQVKNLYTVYKLGLDWEKEYKETLKSLANIQ